MSELPSMWLNSHETECYPDKCACRLERDHKHTGDPAFTYCRLHEAAPELLEACKAIVAIWPEGLGVSDAFLQLARAAIAKAEGMEAVPVTDGESWRKHGRILAASPELLESHRTNASLDVEAIRKEGRLVEVLRQIVADAKAAVAKAEGRAP